MTNNTLNAIGIAMRDNFSDISFSLAFNQAVRHSSIDSLTMCRLFDASPDDIAAWFNGDSFPVQSRRPMILGMLLQSLVVHEEV